MNKGCAFGLILFLAIWAGLILWGLINLLALLVKWLDTLNLTGDGWWFIWLMLIFVTFASSLAINIYERK